MNLHEDGTGLLYVCVRERYVGGLEYLYLGTCICILHFAFRTHDMCTESKRGSGGVYSVLGKCDRSHRTIWCNLLVLVRLNRTLCTLYKVDLSTIYPSSVVISVDSTRIIHCTTSYVLPERMAFRFKRSCTEYEPTR